MTLNRYEFIIKLLKQVEIYDTHIDQKDKLSLSEFAKWLTVQTSLDSLHDSKNTIQAGLGQLVTSMYRYAKLYSKKAMEDTPLSGVDDFGYLITVFVNGEMTKSELIIRNVHEKPTGMEIIKRLIKQGLLAQYDDPKDGRSQLVNITESGKSVLLPLFGKMRQVEELAKGNLDDTELQVLLYLLNKLHGFHYEVFTHEKNIDLDKIKEKYY